MKAVNLEKLLPHDIPAGERILGTAGRDGSAWRAAPIAPI